MCRAILILTIVCSFFGLLHGDGQETPKGAVKFWKDIPEQADVLSATFLGGKGHEWLVSGGFQPDGTIVLVGNVAGPVLDLPEVARVIGTDLDKPDETKRVPVLEKGKQKTDKDSKLLWEKPSWRHDGVTGFVVHCSKDLKKVLSVHRMPWTSGTITAAVVDVEGAITIAGRATDNIVNLSADVDRWEIGADAARKSGGCQHTFVARLRADGAKAVWLRHAKGFSDAPRLELLTDGSVRMSAQDVRVLDADGKLVSAVAVPGGVRQTTSVSPLDDSMVVGGEHHSPTGREPWRCPTLNVHKADGALKYQLYDWGGPYVGLDNLRLVSDSAVRLVRHDANGNILISAWSDGGNSVMTREPADVRSDVKQRGLGITTAGAGVLSAAYIIQMEPKDCRVTAWTTWLAFTPAGKPNSIWIDTMGKADDGSVCFAGRSAWGLWQTKNRLSECEPAGEYVAVLTPDLGGVRFCSAVPGSGVCEVGDGSTKAGSGWNVVSGMVRGRPKMMFIGSAVKEAEVSGKVSATPTKNALQDQFGGGWSDGYVILLDLSNRADKTPPEVISIPEPTEPRPTSASFERGAFSKSAKNAPKPAADAVFHFKPDDPKWVAVDAEFRDRSAKMWPSFLYGKPVKGTFSWKDAKPIAMLTVDCPVICQPKGEQERRVLGELVKGADALPKLMLSLESLGPIKSMNSVDYCEAKGVLELAGKKIAVTPKVTFAFSGPKDSNANRVQLTAWLTLKGADLGLKAPGTEGEIDVRISMSGNVAVQ
ncbi:MAG: hypothetical protein K2R98_07520 [Gemmataceae bacterium]|nr:hypothetical protein [Gemmataceae bacterium]